MASALGSARVLGVSPKGSVGGGMRVLGVVGSEGACSKSKLPTTHNHHHRRRRRRRHNHHLFFELLLKVFIVARVIFKRLNPGAAEDEAEGVLVARRHLPAAESSPRLPLGDT